MAAPKFKKSNVEQTINLKEIFGIDFSGLPQLREVIGEAILQRIRDRTAGGEGMSFGSKGAGRPVKLKSPYSDKYAKSMEFKAAGKSKNKVNMSLTGDMLGLMDIKRQSGNDITIGWTDSDENKKAFNHSAGDTVPRRPFFGVSNKELKDIRSEFKSEIKEAIKLKEDEGRTSFNNKVLNLIESIREDGES
jgi:hypothetical protein